jgi:hypothetical protein
MSEIERDNARLVTSKDKTCPKELLALGELVGVSKGDFSERARETTHRLFKKLILDKLSPAAQSPTGEQKPQSDIPTTIPNLLDPSLPKETLEARKELLEACKRQELHQLKPPDCPFCAKISDTEIECGKVLRKGKKPMLMSTSSCWACYERREYVKRKVEKQKENEAEQKRTQSPQPQKTESRSVEGSTEFRGYLREWNCRKLLRNFSYVKTSELKNKLPCLQDPTFLCDMKILRFYPREGQTPIPCKELLMKKLDLEAPELIKELAEKTIAQFKSPQGESDVQK